MQLGYVTMLWASYVSYAQHLNTKTAFNEDAELYKEYKQGKTPENGTLSDYEARLWYLEQEAKIPDLIDKNLPLEEQAKQAAELRNQFRTQAREYMADREMADWLNVNRPNQTYDEVYQKASPKDLLVMIFIEKL